MTAPPAKEDRAGAPPAPAAMAYRRDGMFLNVENIRAAIALGPSDMRSDFDLNPEIKAAELDLHAPRRAAVLCALRPRDGRLHVILTHRARHLTHHAGQVAFPGGRVDAEDLSIRHTALREAEEEIGLGPRMVDVLGTLDDYLTSTGYRVTPVVGLVDPDFDPRPAPAEVDKVFEPPLDFLMDPANRHRHHHDRNGYRRHYYAIPWQGNYIWGATAGMLKGLSDRLAALSDRLP